MGAGKKKIMNLIFDGYADGKTNMKKDETLLKSLIDGKIKPSLRFYKWKELTLSIGLSQREEDFNFGIPVVKRCTGGRALLHGWDISFALVDFCSNFEKNPLRLYRNLAENFRRVFKALGVQVEVWRYKGYAERSALCFFSPSYGEIVFKGRKVLSYATRMEEGCFLVHGSVYLTFNFLEASRLLDIDEFSIKERITDLYSLGLTEEDFVESMCQVFL